MKANKKGDQNKILLYVYSEACIITTVGVFVNFMTVRRVVNVKECEHECLLKENGPEKGSKRSGTRQNRWLSTLFTPTSLCSNESAATHATKRGPAAVARE
jgi:hypothetical protein